MNVRDIDADVRAAYLAEYKGALISGDEERAAACAEALLRYGVTVGGATETAVAKPAPERRAPAKKAAPKAAQA